MQPPGTRPGHTGVVSSDPNESASEPTVDHSNGAAPVTSAANPDEDETKRRYREALERKKNKGTGSAAGSGEASKSGGATQNSKTQRMFRRKSGG